MNSSRMTMKNSKMIVWRVLCYHYKNFFLCNFLLLCFSLPLQITIEKTSMSVTWGECFVPFALFFRLYLELNISFVTFDIVIVGFGCAHQHCGKESRCAGWTSTFCSNWSLKFYLFRLILSISPDEVWFQVIISWLLSKGQYNQFVRI